ncbi:hypothetical protein FRC00_006142 [Tulasnella sp. 408]|nr:hypothetical protein FRC00_006142 [Tulasnella sp. 408]
MSAPSFPIRPASSLSGRTSATADPPGQRSLTPGVSFPSPPHHLDSSYDFTAPTVLTQLRDMENDVELPPPATVDPMAFLAQPPPGGPLPIMAASSSSSLIVSSTPPNPISLMTALSSIARPISPTMGQHSAASSNSPGSQAVTATGVALGGVISTRHGSLVTVGAVVASVLDNVVQMASQSRDAYLGGKQDQTHTLIEELLESLKLVGGLGVGPMIGEIISNMPYTEDQDDCLMQAPASTPLEGRVLPVASAAAIDSPRAPPPLRGRIADPSSPSTASYRSGSSPRQALLGRSASRSPGGGVSPPPGMNHPLSMGGLPQTVTATGVALGGVIATRNGSQVTVGAVVASVLDNVVQMASQARDAYLAGKRDQTHVQIEELLESLKLVGGLGVGPSIGAISSNLPYTEGQDDVLMQAPASAPLEGWDSLGASVATTYRLC